MAQASRLDKQIVKLAKELNPSGAYMLGFNDYAGKLFVPTAKNIGNGIKALRDLSEKAETDLQRKVLEGFDTAMKFGLTEPQPVLDDILGTIFNHLTKEGINERHLSSLIEASSKALDASQRRFKRKKIPAAVKALALYRLAGVVEILDSIKQSSKSEKLKHQCDVLKRKVQKYVSMFELDGFGEGKFDEIEKFFKKYGFDLGRKKFYPGALRRAFDYHEKPAELERKATKWLDEELVKFRRAIRELAENYHCGATAEEVEEKMNARVPLKPKDLVRTTNAIRRVIQRFVDERVVKINKKYRTKVIETPKYLSGILPTGAAAFFDTFTKNPFQLSFITTDPRRDPEKSFGSLIDLLIHEEYGHCVHHSNSAFFRSPEPNVLELWATTHSGPISEGIAFNREREYLEATKRLERKKNFTETEKAYLRLLGKYGDIHLVNLEIEFAVRKWRVIRFLRVIGDVRVNTGKQDLLAFVDWANKYAHVQRSTMYFQLFPAHEGAFPGYATSYAVVGEELRSIEEKIKDEKTRIAFSTYLSSIGYPPRSLYRKRLQKFVSA
jgi:hypothetical protein